VIGVLISIEIGIMLVNAMLPCNVDAEVCARIAKMYKLKVYNWEERTHKIYRLQITTTKHFIVLYSFEA